MFFPLVITLPLGRLRALVHLIDMVESQKSAKNMTDAAILSASLAPDMFPFAKQIQIATDNAKGMACRLASKDIPSYPDTEETLGDLRARLEKTIAFLEIFREEDFLHADIAEARFPYFPGLKIVGADYPVTYGIPNFFFHVVTAYDILRHIGFDIGKADYMGGQVAFTPDAA